MKIISKNQKNIANLKPGDIIEATREGCAPYYFMIGAVLNEEFDENYLLVNLSEAGTITIDGTSKIELYGDQRFYSVSALIDNLKEEGFINIHKVELEAREM